MFQPSIFRGYVSLREGRWIEQKPQNYLLTQKKKRSLAQDTQEMEVWHWDESDHFGCIMLGKLFFYHCFKVSILSQAANG